MYETRPFRVEQLPEAERIALWTTFLSMYLRLEGRLEATHEPLILRYRIADLLN
jgi:hypothetical protein